MDPIGADRGTEISPTETVATSGKSRSRVARVSATLLEEYKVYEDGFQLKMLPNQEAWRGLWIVPGVSGAGGKAGEAALLMPSSLLPGRSTASPGLRCCSRVKLGFLRGLV